MPVFLVTVVSERIFRVVFLRVFVFVLVKNTRFLKQSLAIITSTVPIHWSVSPCRFLSNDSNGLRPNQNMKPSIANCNICTTVLHINILIYICIYLHIFASFGGLVLSFGCFVHLFSMGTWLVPFTVACGFGLMSYIIRPKPNW